MDKLYFLIGVSWIIFWAYWIVAAARTGIAQGTTSNRRSRLVFLIITVIFFLTASRLFTLGQITFPHRPLLKALGTLMFYGGLALAIWARRHLGNSWGMPMAEHSHPKLVTGGPYRFIRHPIYSGVILGSLGTAIALTRTWFLIFAVGLIFALYSAVKEEQQLARKLPKDFAAYKRRTKMLIPYIF